MFQKITIKDNSLGEQKLDIGSLAEALLFYKEVHLLSDKNTFPELLKFCGIENVIKLIKEERLQLSVRENIIGSMMFPIDKDEKYNVDVFSSDSVTQRTIIYQGLQEILRNSTKSIKYTDIFLELTNPHRYDKSVVDEIRTDFENTEYLKKGFITCLGEYLPDYTINIDGLVVELIKDSSFGPFDAYTLNTNLNFDELNAEFKKLNPNIGYSISPGSIILNIAEARGDIHLSSNLDSELMTRGIYSRLIQLKMEDIYKTYFLKQENIGVFQDFYLEDFKPVGNTIKEGHKSFSEFIEVLVKADKFKDWLSKVDEDRGVIKEYYSTISKETWIDKLPSKWARFAIFEGAAMLLDAVATGGIATIAATALGAADTFLLDKVVKGWKPNHFVDKEMKEFLEKKEKK